MLAVAVTAVCSATAGAASVASLVHGHPLLGVLWAVAARNFWRGTDR